jgi:hypothetical protein
LQNLVNTEVTRAEGLAQFHFPSPLLKFYLI